MKQTIDSCNSDGKEDVTRVYQGPHDYMQCERKEIMLIPSTIYIGIRNTPGYIHYIDIVYVKYIVLTSLIWWQCVSM